jgi:hypothetical protein
MTAPGNCGRQTSADHPRFEPERKGEMVHRPLSAMHAPSEASGSKLHDPAFQALHGTTQMRNILKCHNGKENGCRQHFCDIWTVAMAAPIT